MNIRRLWAKNCRTWQQFDLALPLGVTAVVGENGAGKSTLVNVADFALFGGRDLGRLLTRGSGETGGEVGCEFEHAGKAYRVTRRFGAKPSLDLQRLVGMEQEYRDLPGRIGEPVEMRPLGEPKQTWQALTRETMAATQAELEELLGLDRQSFRASAFLAQGDGAAFTEAPPRERKEILARVLGLAEWDRLRERAARDRADEEHTMSKLLGAIEQAEGQLELRPGAEAILEEARLLANQARADRDDLERGLAGVIEELEEAQRIHLTADAVKEKLRSLEDLARVQRGREAEALEAVNDAAKAAEELARSPELGKAEELEDEAREAMSKAEALAGALASQNSAYNAAQAAVDSAQRQREAIIEEAARLAADFDSLSSDSPLCPTCQQPLVGASVERVRGEMAKKQAELNERMQAAERHILDAVEHADAEGLALEKLGDGPDIAEARKEYGLARQRLLRAQDLRRQAEGLSAKRARWKDAQRDAEQAAEEVQQLQQRLQGIGPLPDLEALQQRRTKANLELSERVRQASEAEQRAAKAEARLEQYAALEETLAKDRAAHGESLRRVQLFKRLEEACGRNGVPALILEAIALPFLEAEASRVISELGRSFRVELRSQRATKGGDIREALDIVISTPEGEADYADFSGGEQTRLNIALRVALARLLANRRGADVRFLVIDEPTHLDEQGFARLAEVMKRLEEFDRILVVSHVSTLRDAFDSVLSVEGGGDSGEPSRLA